MKYGIILVCSFVFLAQSFSLAQTCPAPLKSLYDSKSYFELRDTVEKYQKNDSPEMLFYKGVVYNKFNRPDLSELSLKQFRTKCAENTDKEMLKEADGLLADSYTKLYRYRDAADMYDYILKNFTAELDSEETSDFKNSARLFRAFAGVSPQVVNKAEDTKLTTFKDKAGLTNLKVISGKDSIDFIFDTGANISTLSLSTAKEMGVKILGDSIMVTSITGNKVPAQLGALPSVHFGNITLSNVLCLIFDDTELSFPQAGYFIHGVLGFPAIEALGEIELTKDGVLVVPSVTPERHIRNMALDALTPLIQGTYKGKKLAFTFDTGAKFSMLNYCFYKEFESEVKAECKPDSLKFGGAGGMTSVLVYIQKQFNLDIAGKNVGLSDTRIVAKATTDNSKYFYGNLGQDIIKQFDKMIINFKSMSILFE